MTHDEHLRAIRNEGPEPPYDERMSRMVRAFVTGDQEAIDELLWFAEQDPEFERRMERAVEVVELARRECQARILDTPTFRGSLADPDGAIRHYVDRHRDAIDAEMLEAGGPSDGSGVDEIPDSGAKAQAADRIEEPAGAIEESAAHADGIEQRLDEPVTLDDPDDLDGPG